MKNINNKITSMKENLKEITGKYTPFYKNSTVPKENIEKPSEQDYREMYYEREVNQSFMG